LKNRTISIGVPVLNESQNIPELIRELIELKRKFHELGLQLQVQINDNASTDGTDEVLKRCCAGLEFVRLKRLPFQVSYQASILDLIRDSKGDAFAVLQGDLQDPPMLLVEFAKRWIQGSLVIVGVGRYDSSLQRYFFNLPRMIFYNAMNWSSDGGIIPRFQDFFLIDRKVVEILKSLQPDSLFLRGHIATRFGEVDTIEYSRRPRVAGKSNFNFNRKYSLAIDGFLMFSNKFLRLITVASIMLFGVGLIGAFALLVLWIAGYEFPFRGWASVVFVLLILLSATGLFFGLILEYLQRIYKRLFGSY